MEKEINQSQISLCLSGGGSRAMAFHLGCLKALNKFEILDKVNLISTVSGGSVIGAYYAYSNGTFEDFEKEITKQLQSGFQFDVFLDFAKGKFIIYVLNLLAILFLGAAYHTLSILKLPNDRIKKYFLLPRYYSRINSLVFVFNKRLFADKVLSAETRNNLEIIINACELGTSTAFRFGNRTVSNWIFGFVDPGDVLIAEAVTSSAAYPAFLPALNKKMTFTNSKNLEKKKIRVSLTDGGVYDNLGISPLFPDRATGYGYPTTPSDYIIACDAGQGAAFVSENFQWMLPRLVDCFNSTMRRVQSLNFKLLFEFKKNEKIKGVVLAYLGQDDSRLPAPNNLLVKREDVIDYPTDFKAMKLNDLNKIRDRGEQVMSLQIETHLKDLLSK